MPPGSVASIPEVRQSSRSPATSSAMASSSHRSARGGSAATASSRRRARAGSRAARASTASRTLCGISPRTGPEYLGHEERIAARLIEQVVGIEPVRSGQLGDARARQAREREPLDLACRHELAEHDPQRVGGGELVLAVGGDYESRDRCDPVAEQPEHVERGAVGLVDVLEDDDRRSPAVQLAGERGHDLVGLAALRDQLAQIAARDLRDVEERARGRGVKSASQLPHRARTPSSSSQKRRTSAVFPTPASPLTRASRPRRESATACSPAASADS